MAYELNSQTGMTSPKNANYILLIPFTIQFKLYEDLQRLLKKKLQSYDFQKIFKKLKVHVMYFTLFTKCEKRFRGPIAEDTSTKICTLLLQKKCGDAKIVGPTHLKNKFNIITVDQFNLLL